MRLLGRLLQLLILLAILLPAGQYLRERWQPPARLPAELQQTGVTSRSATVYFLSPRSWLTFPLHSQADRARVLSNVGSAPDTPADLALRYSLHYQLLDADQRLLHEGSYSHQTRLPPRLSHDGQPLPRNLYADRALAVAAGQSFILQLSALPGAAYLRLRLEELAPPLRNLAVRVYFEERMSAASAAIQWERLSEARRSQLAADMIYPPSLLLASERSNLLQRQWKPVGPLEPDARQDRLYSPEGGELAPEPPAISQRSGLYVASDRFGALPLPGDGDYLLEFQPLHASDTPLQLTLSHFGAQVAAPEVQSLSLLPGQTHLRLALRAGLLQVQASQPGMLDLYAAGAEQDSLLPEPAWLRSRQLQPGQSLQFSLSPDERGVLPLRLDLRAFGAGSALPASQMLQASYQVFDRSGQRLQEGQLQAEVVPSPWDRNGRTPEIADLSEPASFYLRLPPAAARLQLGSAQALLVTGWSRPDDLPHRTRVPEDYYSWQGDNSGQPGWFLLQPLAAADAVEVLLHTQPRPPQRDPQLLAGRYLWQSLDPLPGARGARLLLPLDPQDSVRPAGLPAYFSPLQAGSQSIEIRTPDAVHQLQPSLLFLRDSASAFDLRLSIDGQPVQHALSGQRGQLRLPPLTPGRHQLTLHSSSPARWLLNYRQPAAGSFQQRLAWQLGSAPLRFSLQHQRSQPRLLGARFHSSAPAGGSTQIRLRVRPAGERRDAASGWTHRERIYQLQPDAQQAGSGYLLDRQQGRVSDGLALFFELGDDLADGPLQLEFERIAGAAGYLVLYEILPGEHARADSFRESRP